MIVCSLFETGNPDYINLPLALTLLRSFYLRITILGQYLLPAHTESSSKLSSLVVYYMDHRYLCSNAFPTMQRSTTKILSWLENATGRKPTMNEPCCRSPPSEARTPWREPKIAGELHLATRISASEQGLSARSVGRSKPAKHLDMKAQRPKVLVQASTRLKQQETL